MYKNKNIFSAFTLAETLITLVIVGVIAAITVPSLIAKYHDEQLKSQFKKTYSTMSQALNRTSMIDFSNGAECYYPVHEDLSNDGSKTRDCKDFFKTFAKNMNVIKECNGNAKSEGCVPTYMHYNEGNGCTGFSSNAFNNANTVYVLSDGQIVILYGNTNNNPIPLIAVDINGKKGPNKWGYDLFSFLMGKTIKDGNIFLRPDGCEIVERNGRRAKQMMQHAFAGVE